MPLPDIPDTSWQDYQSSLFKQATDAAITGLTTSYGTQIDALRAKVAPENRVWVDRAVAAAKKYNVDPYIYAKQIYQESGFSPTAGSNEGARGIAQFTDPTAKAFGVNAWNPDQSLDAGARYMRQNLNATGGDYRLALASYNAGGGNVAKYGQNIFNPAYLRAQGWSEQDANQPATYIRNILGDQTPAVAPVQTQPTMGAQQPAPTPNPNAAWNQSQRASFNQAVQSTPDTSAWSSVTVPPITAPTVSFRDHAQAKMDALGGADATQYPADASAAAGGILPPTSSPAFGSDALGPIGGGTSAGTLGRSDTFRGSPGAGSELGGDPANGLAPSSVADVQPPTDNQNLKDFAIYATSKIASLSDPAASTTPTAPLGYNDMAGASSSPGAPAFGSNPQDVTSPIDQARVAAVPPNAAPPSPPVVSGAYQPPGYNDMAGVNTAPTPAFGVNPQDVSSPIEQARAYTGPSTSPSPFTGDWPSVTVPAATPAPQPLPQLLGGSQPLTDLGNQIIQGERGRLATQSAAMTPTLGTRADQPAREQVTPTAPGRFDIRAGYTPSQLAAQQSTAANIAMGSTGVEKVDVARDLPSALETAKSSWVTMSHLARQEGIDLANHDFFLPAERDTLKSAPGSIQNARDQIDLYNSYTASVAADLKNRIGPKIADLSAAVQGQKEANLPELGIWAKAFMTPQGYMKERVPLGLWMKVSGAANEPLPIALSKVNGRVYVNPQLVMDKWFERGEESRAMFGKEFTHFNDFEAALAQEARRLGKGKDAEAELRRLTALDQQVSQVYQDAIPSQQALNNPGNIGQTPRPTVAGGTPLESATTGTLFDRGPARTTPEPAAALRGKQGEIPIPERSIPTAGPVSGLEPSGNAQSTARASVEGARLPNGQRAPIWMQAAPRALDNTAVGRVAWTDAEITSSERLIQRHQLLADNARAAGDLAQAAQYDADVTRFRSQLAANRPGAPTELPSLPLDLTLPANSPLRSRPAGALPSGRVPGSLGTTSKPYSPEVAGAATKRALAIPVKGFAQQVEDASGRFLRESYDRLYPLRELDKQAGLGPNVGSHATAQVFSGAIAAGEDAAQRYVMPVIKSLGADGADLEKWWVLQQSRDVLAKFKDSKLPGNIDGLGGIQREEAVIKQRLGPERFAKVQAAADQLWKLNDELRLKPLEEAGMLKPGERAQYRNENPHYIPFDRYVHSAEDPSNLLPRTSSNLSVSSSGIKARTAAGAVHALDNPMARWVSDIIQTPVVVSRNRAAKSIVDALKKAEKATGQKLIVEAPESAAQAAKIGQATVDRGTISYFDPARPGVRMVANVPAIYATVAKGLEAETSNVLSRLASALATPLRLGATGLDPSFMIVNTVRDLQSAWMKEGLTPTSPYYIAGLKAAIARNTDFEAAAKAGGLHSGLMETRKSTDALKRAQQIQGIQVNNVQDALLLIPKLMAKVPGGILRANEVIEQAPRIGTFLKARAEGASTLEAGVRMRDVSVDFDKSGNAMRVLNQAVPFLNARTQGGANLVRTFRDNPKQALLRAAPLVVPEVLFFLWNRRYESSSLIPPYEYDRSYIFQVGESTESKDPKNPNAPAQKIPIYIKIPKGDPAAVVTAPVTAMLQAAFQQGDRSSVELILHAAQAATQGLSPIDPNLNSAISTLTPPLLNTSWQINQNRNTFTGRDIVPQGELGRPASQQYDATTSRTAVALGEQFHVSPRLIDFAIRNYAGGTGHNAEWLSDLALGALGYNPQAPGQAMKQPLTDVQRAATMPGVSRFLGARNTAEQIQGAQSLNDAVNQTRDLLYQNAEFKRFGIGVQPVNSYITYDGQQVPLTPDEQVLYQTRLGQQMKKDLDALPNRQVYKNYKTDALKRRAIQAVMDHAREIVQNQMLHDIGPISSRLKAAS